MLDYCVPRRLGSDLHRILKSSAPPFFDTQAKTIAGLLRGDEIVQSQGCCVCESDHVLFIGMNPCKVKRMGNIRLLPDHVASQVAAGEVVERPASVVKELVENSIDAGARRVRVEFAGGGSRLVRVSDDGCGMDREDALMSLERHATSKIRVAKDLATVATMGFRGEAVPSIASVSRFRLITRRQEDSAGTEIIVSGGKIDSVSESGSAPGTIIEVSDLFHNVPARKKFLRGEETESARIIHQMQSLALAHPGVALSLSRDGRTLWQAAPTNDLLVRVRDLFGNGLTDRLMPLATHRENEIELRGLIAKPGEGRPDRDLQFVILNGRIVQCPAVFKPLREAYAEAIPKGRHPLAVLQISMDPLAFDCNVHPAKREVRLHRPDQLRQAVFNAAQLSIEALRSTPPTASRSSTFPPVAPPRINHSLEPKQPLQPFSPHPQMELPKSDRKPDPAPDADYRLIGGLADRWILMEGNEGLVMVDTRAASERILFETMRKEAANGSSSVQALLIPAVVELTQKDAVWVSEHLQALRSAGFHVESFGGTSFMIEALPSCLSESNPESALLDVCETLRATGLLGSEKSASDALLRSVARVAALNSFRYEEQMARRLIRDLLRCELPYACPQGRPTMIQWSLSELDRRFGR
jgi:DNA mismatch repair protein MutL